MKKILALAALAALPAFASAQVTLGPATVVNVGSVAVAPQGLEIVNDVIYGTGFTNQVVFSITDPVGTPVAGTLVNISTATAWGSGRGPQDIDAIGTTLYVFGDGGTNGAGANPGIILPIDSTTGTPGTAIVPAVRATGGLPLSSTQFYAGEADSSTPEVLDGAGATTSSGALGPVGFRAPLRDAVAVGTSVFFLSGATNGDPHTILQYTGVATPGNFTGSSAVGFFTSTGSGSRNHIGLATYNDGTTDWLVMAQSNGTLGSIAFVDATNAANTVSLASADLAGRQLTGLTVGQIGGTDYVAVASQNGGTNPNEVYIFEINPGSNVDEWNMY